MVLKVTPADNGAMAGFQKEGAFQFLNVPVEVTEEGLFVMRIGDEPVEFFILPKDHQTNYSLELVEVTDIDNPQYEDVAVY